VRMFQVKAGSVPYMHRSQVAPVICYVPVYIHVMRPSICHRFHMTWRRDGGGGIYRQEVAIAPRRAVRYNGNGIGDM